MTKLFSLALAALLATTAMASAQDGPSAAMSQGMIFTGGGDDASDDNVMRIEFNRVDSSDAGVIEVYDYANGELGELIASESVDAGTNWRINIPLGRNFQNAVIAQLKIDGEVVDQRTVGDVR